MVRVINSLHSKGYLHRNISVNSIGMKKRKNGKCKFLKLGGFDFIHLLKPGQVIRQSFFIENDSFAPEIK